MTLKFEIDPAYPEQTCHEIANHLDMLAVLFAAGAGGIDLTEASLCGLYDTFIAMRDAAIQLEGITRELESRVQAKAA
jgi:hypothetical protein